MRLRGLGAAPRVRPRLPAWGASLHQRLRLPAGGASLHQPPRPQLQLPEGVGALRLLLLLMGLRQPNLFGGIETIEVRMSRLRQRPPAALGLRQLAALGLRQRAALPALGLRQRAVLPALGLRQRAVLPALGPTLALLAVLVMGSEQRLRRRASTKRTFRHVPRRRILAARPKLLPRRLK